MNKDLFSRREKFINGIKAFIILVNFEDNNEFLTMSAEGDRNKNLNDRIIIK